MIDKIVIGLSFLLASNLIVSTLTLNTQAIVLGFHTNNTTLTIISIISGVFLGYSIRGLAESSGKKNEEEEW